MTIEKKSWPAYFEAIKRGGKNFEIRLADFKLSVGDVLLLKEWDPKTRQYTGRSLRKKVTYLLKTKDLKFHKPKEIKKYGYYVVGLN